LAFKNSIILHNEVFFYSIDYTVVFVILGIAGVIMDIYFLKNPLGFFTLINQANNKDNDCRSL
jgi:hypothetical protein